MTDFDWIEVQQSSDFLETSDTDITMKEYEEACESLANFKGF